MVSRKEKKRQKKIRKLEKAVDVNDFCDYMYVCKKPYCTKKFGRYYSCPRWQAKDPRLDSRTSALYD